MAGATDLAIRIATTLDATGINRADKAIGKLQKSVRTFSTVLGGVAVAAFAKKSLKAFVDDELAATRLANAVKNLGMEFANPFIANYISDLEKTSKVADDVLRPAFQRLLQQTGSLAKSQDILNTAIEVSRGTGDELGSVTEDLAKAYYGNTRSLKKYSLGLTEAELKAKSFSEIQDILNKKFTGSSAAYLDTYAGQISVLSLAWNNLQENAGKALFTLAGANGDQSSGARRLGTIVDAFGVGLIEAAKLLNNAATAFGQAYFGVGSAKTPTPPAAKPGEELFRKSMSNDAKLKAIEKQQAALYKQQMLALKKITDEQKKQAALKKAGSIFDLEQIQIVAALKGKLTAEERLRLEAQAAILNDNSELATTLTKQILMAQDSSGKLYQYFLSIGDAKIKNPFSFLDEWILTFQKKLDALKIPDLSKPSTYTGAGLDPALAAIGIKEGYGANVKFSTDNQASNELLNGLYGMQSTAGFVSTSGVTGSNVNVYVSGSVVTEQELVDAIQTGLRSNSLSGSPSQIGRIAGMFG